MRSFVNIIISGGSFLALALNSGFVRLASYKSSTQFISLYSHNPDCSFIFIILKIYYYSLYHIFSASEEIQAHLHGAAQAVIGNPNVGMDVLPQMSLDATSTLPNRKHSA